MRYNSNKPQSFLYNFIWVQIMLATMGFIFLGIGIIMQLVPINPESVTVYINGVRQPSTLETVQTFRLIFLLIFGLIGLILISISSILMARKWAFQKQEQFLKESGTRLTAQVTRLTYSNIRVNYHRLKRLQCTYTNYSGKTYIFKSKLLRMDPTPYLKENEVTVYYDSGNMKRYFVDIDGSIRAGTQVFEL